ncbi:hypothetical protein JX265_008626 [Neoarthrinium moseri]|uniref:Uncharacterized protein n=1 Tax=Neoarthrinium moseri TaxID=1658444 RepID=A0A9Q0ANJ2_9PEZI|nr:hypothetical protein JX265_008626 [Neoarthrinium moseri]
MLLGDPAQSLGFPIVFPKFRDKHEATARDRYINPYAHQAGYPVLNGAVDCGVNMYEASTGPLSPNTTELRKLLRRCCHNYYLPQPCPHVEWVVNFLKEFTKLEFRSWPDVRRCLTVGVAHVYEATVNVCRVVIQQVILIANLLTIEVRIIDDCQSEQWDLDIANFARGEVRSIKWPLKKRQHRRVRYSPRSWI